MKAPIDAARGMRGESGAVFVQVGFAVFVLVSFNVFVLDYGIMWMSRRQAQNAADAGAFAGAVARNYDDFDDPPSSTGRAAQSATQTAAANLIWQEPGESTVSFDCPAGITGRCVRVDVHRDSSSGNPLPTVFGPLLGVASQGVQATATAQAVNGNATDCLRPFAFPDEWIHHRSPIEEFNKYFESGPSAGLPLPFPQDAYFPPDSSQAVGTNLDDLGDRINFRLDRPPLTDPIVSGFLLPLNLPGTSTYLQDIATCNGEPVALRELMPLAPPPAGGATYAALQALVAQDPGATWDFSRHTIGNSCAPGCAAVSPRLIAVALFDPDQYQQRRATGDWSGCPTAGPCVTIANIAAVFIHRLSGGTGHGHLLRYPGQSITTAPTFVDEGTWLVTTTLIR